MDISGKSSRSAQSPATPAKVSRSLLLATDLQQSILAELDQSGPNRRAYSAYGVPSSQRPPGSRLGFNGQISERSTGWYHLGNGHRIYNPVLMRFHSPDRLSPFGKGGINAYAYCQGDPINFTDPTGRFLSAAVNVAANALNAVTGAVVSAAQVSVTYQRSLSAILNLELLGNALTVMPASGGMLRSFQASAVGAVLNTSGALLQIGGISSGTYVANLGITFSAAGLGYRVGSAARDLYLKNNLWTRVKSNFWNLLGYPPAASSTTAAGNPVSAPFTINPPSQPVSIPMDDFPGTNPAAYPAAGPTLASEGRNIRLR